MMYLGKFSDESDKRKAIKIQILAKAGTFYVSISCMKH